MLVIFRVCDTGCPSVDFRSFVSDVVVSVSLLFLCFEEKMEMYLPIGNVVTHVKCIDTVAVFT